MTENLHEQLHKYLTDIHSIEVQALAQLRTAPKIAGDEHLLCTISQFDCYAAHFGEVAVDLFR